MLYLPNVARSETKSIVPCLAFDRRAERGTRAYFARRIPMPGKTIPTRRFRIYRREDGRYVSLSEHPGESPLGVDFSLNQAIGSATRETVLASREGCRVVIEVQQSNKSWKKVDVIKPPPTTR